MLKISLESVHKKVLQTFFSFLTTFLLRSESIHSCVFIPAKKCRLTLLRSPHVYKRSKEQFSLRHHKVVLFVQSSCSSKNLLRWLFLNSPRSVCIKLKTKS